MVKKSKVSQVSETNIGIYVWQLPDGSFLNDGNPLNILSIGSMRGDIQKMAAITAAAKYNGYPDGTPVFVEGKRKITDEEFDEQRHRASLGLTPDPYDIGEYNDRMRGIKNGYYSGN